MASEWREVTLNELVSIKHGFAFKGAHFSEKPTCDIILTPGNFHVGGGFKAEKFKYYTSRYPQEYILDEGDIVVSMTDLSKEADTLGYPAIIPKCKNGRYLHNQRLGLIQIKQNDLIGKRYLYYLLCSKEYRDEILANYSGTTVKHTSPSKIGLYRFNLPPLSEQRTIAHILGSLDDKIELNRQMNQTLEQMAQAMFKSWFVDFDSVIDNALAIGNEIPEELLKKAEQRLALGENRKPLPENIKELFPSEFEFSEELDKWIPKGWKAKTVENCIAINPKVKLTKGTVTKFVDMKALPTSGYSVDGVIEKEFTGGGAKFENGDVLLARITPCLENGKTGIVDFLNKNEVAFGSTEFIVLRGQGEIKTPFIACLARENSFREHCILNMVGSSGRQRVQNAAFNNFYLAMSDDIVLSRFHLLTEPYFLKIAEHTSEIQSLTKLRDTLLPKLISGEVRVGDLEVENIENKIGLS